MAAGKLLFLSCCDGTDPQTGTVDADNVEQQIIVALNKVRTALEEAGSSMDRIVKTLIMLKRLDDYSTMRRTELEYYQQHAPRLVSNPPVSTFVQLPSITSPETLFQIDVTAVL